MKPLAPLLLAATLFSPTAIGQSISTEVLAVDVLGTPLPGVTLELVDTEPGAFGAPEERRTIVTDKDGRAALPAEGVLPLDLALPDESPWALSFVHAVAHVDETASTDLLGRPLSTLPPEGEVVCVLERLGTLALEIEGANDDERFTVTFSDVRPQPDAHRTQRRTAHFKGPRAQLPMPPGRGTLFLARKGTLGTEVRAADGRPLMIAITPGETSLLRVEARDHERPTIIMAAFSQIPFPEVEALAPDGETVVSTFPFESSPLRLVATVSTVRGSGGGDGASVLPRTKHLLRAKGVPLVREAPAQDLFSEPGRDQGPPASAPAPLDMIFAANVGMKLRLPEVEGGWVKLARECIVVREGVVRGAAAGLATRVSVSAAASELPGDGAEWAAVVRTVLADGAPAPYAEVLFRLSGQGSLVRLVTGRDGTARVTGLRGDAVRVELLHGFQVASTIGRPLDGGTETAVELTVPASTRVVRGRWKGADGEPCAAGAVLRLAGLDGSTRFAVADSDGRFSFGAVAPGEVTVAPFRVPGGAEAATLKIPSGEAPFEILVTGSENAPVSVETRTAPSK